MLIASVRAPPDEVMKGLPDVFRAGIQKELARRREAQSAQAEVPMANEVSTNDTELNNHQQKLQAVEAELSKAMRQAFPKVEFHLLSEQKKVLEAGENN
jgi:hypothetical protein